jgi:hypothetical protein
VGIGRLVAGGLLWLRAWRLGRKRLLLPSRSILGVVWGTDYGDVCVRGCGRKLRWSVDRDGVAGTLRRYWLFSSGLTHDQL